MTARVFIISSYCLLFRPKFLSASPWPIYPLPHPSPHRCAFPSHPLPPAIGLCWQTNPSPGALAAWVLSGKSAPAFFVVSKPNLWRGAPSAAPAPSFPLSQKLSGCNAQSCCGASTLHQPRKDHPIPRAPWVLPLGCQTVTAALLHSGDRGCISMSSR